MRDLPISIRGVQFNCDGAQVCQSQRLECLRLDGKNLVEDRGLDLALRINQSVQDTVSSSRRAERIYIDHRAIRVLRVIVYKILNCLKLLWSGGNRIADEATPKETLIKGDYIKPGNDTKIVRATFEGQKEVGVGAGVGIDDDTGGKDDLL